jgi:hypothetical protein
MYGACAQRNAGKRAFLIDPASLDCSNAGYVPIDIFSHHIFGPLHRRWRAGELRVGPQLHPTTHGKETIGNGHGEIACDAAGNFYISVQEADAGIQVYSPEGKFLKALKLPGSLHGFVIRKDGAEEFIFAAVLGESRVLKAKLDGTIMLEIPTASFPAEQRDFVTVSKANAEDIGKPKPRMEAIASGVKIGDTPTAFTLKLADGSEKEIPKERGVSAAGGLKLTNCDVAPNGDIYVVDGYGRSWIFVFDHDGKFKKVFGGPGEPLKLANTHKIFIDRRFEPARIFACDRGNNRILHLDLDGNLISVIADQGLRRPSSASFHGDLVCVAEIAGRVSVWNKEGKQVAELGVNDTTGQTNTPKVEPKDWRVGTVTSPHGITFDNAGNILETEWNVFGRVLRWNKK